MSNFQTFDLSAINHAQVEETGEVEVPRRALMKVPEETGAKIVAVPDA